MKTKKAFVCTGCGVSSPKWSGKCTSCGEWNTLKEEVVLKPSKSEQTRQSWKKKDVKSIPLNLNEIPAKDHARMELADTELTRTLGGGLVPGSITLVGGEPGIGKSTLLLQLAVNAQYKVLYVSGEESPQQIKMRADRISTKSHDCYIYPETNCLKVLATAQEFEPSLLIIDSIQTIHSPHIDSIAGSVSQVRECTAQLQNFAKETDIPVVLIGHITKEGSIAGPKILEHIVDTVLQFEGDRNHIYRILRTKKNRFGSTDEIGIYAMEQGGLRQVKNPSELLLSQSEEGLSGSTVACIVEGMRPMLIETQALVSQAIYGNPQRSVTGYDLRRLNMLLAVLEKKAGLYFGQNDVFLNIAGGIKIVDTASDLALIAALVSSLNDQVISEKACFAGEVGLTGEIRAVNRIEQRILEAERLGFTDIYLSKYNKLGNASKRNIRIHQVSKVTDLISDLFG